MTSHDKRMIKLKIKYFEAKARANPKLAKWANENIIKLKNQMYARNNSLD